MIKPIETVYSGYKFRSRLEARWAVFFDTLGIKYEYEKEGYDLDGTRYLPDFWLPEQKCFIEIKGEEPTEGEKKKAELLAEHTCKNVHIFYGGIEIPDSTNYYKKVFSVGVQDADINTYTSDWGWAQCPFCLCLDITYWSRIDSLPCQCHEYIEPFMYGNPLLHLLKIYPDLAIKEPRDTFDGRVFSHIPAIQRWWRDKCKNLIYAGDSPRLIAAYTAARQARFEYGGR